MANTDGLLSIHVVVDPDTDGCDVGGRAPSHRRSPSAGNLRMPIRFLTNGGSVRAACSRSRCNAERDVAVRPLNCTLNESSARTTEVANGLATFWRTRVPSWKVTGPTGPAPSRSTETTSSPLLSSGRTTVASVLEPMRWTMAGVGTPAPPTVCVTVVTRAPAAVYWALRSTNEPAWPMR